MSLPSLRRMMLQTTLAVSPRVSETWVKEMTKKKCWLCGYSEKLEVGHMFGQEEEQTNVWKEKGLIDFPLRSGSNGVALCKNCHNEFDAWDDPGFVFFPTDLKYFIREERKNRREREANPTLPRTVPSAYDYREYQLKRKIVTDTDTGGMYIPVILKPRLLAVESSLEDEDEDDLAAAQRLKAKSLTHPRTWHGAPIASIRRAVHILGNARASMILTKVQHHDLSELLKLYFPPEPTPQPILEDRHRQEDNNEGNSEPDDQRPATGHNAKRRKLHHPAPKTTTSKTTTYQTNRENRGRFTKTTTKVWCPDLEMWVTPSWVFGPEMSSEEIVRMSSRFLLA